MASYMYESQTGHSYYNFNTGLLDLRASQRVESPETILRTTPSYSYGDAEDIGPMLGLVQVYSKQVDVIPAHRRLYLT